MIRSSLLASLFLFSAPVMAGEPVVVVELFTSQGCSSCPPADKIIGDLTTRSDVLPLTLNVDYWDYLGWRDDFAKPEYSERQRKYGHMFKQRSIYTPSVVVNGSMHVVGNRDFIVESSIEDHAKIPVEANIDLVAEDGKVNITVNPVISNASPSNVWFVSYFPPKTVAIKRGENAGKELTYWNTLQSRKQLSEWDGKETLSLTEDIPEDAAGVAVIVQYGDVGMVTAASKLDF